MTRLRSTLVFSTVLLAACSSGEFSDLKEFVDQSGQGLRGHVDPLPQVKAYEPMTYNAFDLPDPFKPRKTVAEAGAGGGVQPPSGDRRKEPLEAYPLESLKMVGTLEKARQRWALVKTPDGNLYRVKKDNYMGQNFGKIAMISDSSIALTELIQDTTGSWSERTSNLQLLEEEEKKK
jgi:type IV pilus assembly protein PilP